MRTTALLRLSHKKLQSAGVALPNKAGNWHEGVFIIVPVCYPGDKGSFQILYCMI